MMSTYFSYITYYCVPAFFIGLSHEVPLDGKNVRDAKPNELPFVVSIEKRGVKDNFCVGTLISRQSVLTVAHCLFGWKYNKVDIRIGSPDLREGKRYKPKSWISYDQWMNISGDLQLSSNDIAVITLTKKVKDYNAAPVLTFARQDLDNSKVRIAGWGLPQNGVQPMVLKTAILTVITNDQCDAIIESMLHKQIHVPEKFFCSLVDPWVLGDCGDSGAPILNKQNQVVGIHRGVCPNIAQFEDPKEFVRQNLVNLHLHLLPYRKFINAVKI